MEQRASSVQALRILVLGGTGFLGPHVVEMARARGHALTLFNRGKRAPDLFPDVEALRGDRDGALDALRGRTWDAVIDTSGYVPRVVRQSAELLAKAAGHYVFVSTISVYEDSATPGADETAQVRQLPPGEEASEDVSQRYGELKAACEEVVEAAMPGRTLRIRPGLIVGPLDPTDRFTYWPVRMARGGDVLAPGDGSDPVQVIDARDLASWLVRSVEGHVTGTFDATGPATRLVMRDVLEACRVDGVDARPEWVPWTFLEPNGVQAWSDMPAWVPAEGESAGFGARNCSRAIAAGLAFRPLTDTARDTLAWWRSLPSERRDKPRAGMAPEREAEVLAAWRRDVAGRDAASARR